MVRYNPSIIANLKPQDFIDQIDALKARKEEILAFFDAGRLASKPKMRAIIEARFKDLDRIRGYYEVELSRTARQIKPRTLKSPADMYREFTEDEVNDFWQNQGGDDYYEKLQNNGGNTGWELLFTICAARGFDARPDVVDDAAFWAKAASAKYHMFRGVDPRGSDKNYFADDFKYNDACYYGTVGIYGEGIYFHVNDSSNADRTPSGYKKTSAYHNALGYACGGAVIEACLEDDAKVITVADAMEEVSRLAAGNSAALKAAQAELDNAKAEYDRVSDELENLTDNTKKQVKSSMHWDDASYIDIPLQIDQIIDWGAIDDDGNPAYMKFDDFMDNHLRGWVTANGGTITERVTVQAITSSRCRIRRNGSCSRAIGTRTTPSSARTVSLGLTTTPFASSRNGLCASTTVKSRMQLKKPLTTSATKLSVFRESSVRRTPFIRISAMQ